MTAEGATNLPAHQTKHLSQLPYHFRTPAVTFLLHQTDTSGSTGSSLWLSSQVLASYLVSEYRPSTRPPPERVIELGAGTGLLSLLLAHLGSQHVSATDIPPVLDAVLSPNVQRAALGNRVHVTHLDWSQPSPLTQDRFDLILTADTVYQPSLTPHLWATISKLLTTSPKARVLLALERRDPATIDHAISLAQSDYKLSLHRIPHRKVRKAFNLYGHGNEWDPDDWQGVEIWST